VPGTWQTAEARHRFPDVIDGAIAGEPQFIRHRDGREVVLVSRTYFDATRPNLKNFLLGHGFVAGDDGFDAILRDVRRTASILSSAGADPGEAADPEA
jgi:hypothetical protein